MIQRQHNNQYQTDNLVVYKYVQAKRGSSLPALPRCSLLLRYCGPSKKVAQQWLRVLSSHFLVRDTLPSRFN